MKRKNLSDRDCQYDPLRNIFPENLGKFAVPKEVGKCLSVVDTKRTSPIRFCLSCGENHL